MTENIGVNSMKLSSLLLLFLVLSCNHPPSVEEIEPVLKKAGSNRKELVKVISHYSVEPKDSLKRKAAIFLILNLDGFSYLEGEQLDSYFSYLKVIKRDEQQEEYIARSFQNLYKPFDKTKLKKQYDIEHVKAKDLISNIEMAFKVWKEQPWGKDISFDQFCEYILPFRIANEIPEYNREEIYNRFNPLLDSIRKVGGDAVSACKVLTDELLKDHWSSASIGFLPHLPASKLLQHRIGSCRDMTDAAIYIMRAVGIPVTSDIAPQWAYKSSGHGWNTVLNKDGKHVMFMGMGQSPGTTNKPGSKKGKVYRLNYSINPQSLAVQNSQEDTLPPFFLNPRLRDVTEEYVKCFTVTIPVLDMPASNNHYAYLSVFNNTHWIPIHWGKVKDNSVHFFKTEGNIVYLPVYYNSTGFKPANYPIILNKEGEIILLKPDSLNLNKRMRFTAIYPLMPDQFRVTKLWGGRLQGANRPDFTDAINLHTMMDPMPFLNQVTINIHKRFRYVRYLPAAGYATDISELSFYRSGIKLEGKLIGSNGTTEKDERLKFILDQNFLTRFVTWYSTGTWIGLDLGRPQNIDAAEYAAGVNSKKHVEIEIGDSYELFYWDGQDKWVSKGITVATGGEVIFKDIPSNALYFLKNISKNVDKRIFTYENDKQVWW